MQLFHKTYGESGPSLVLLHGWGFNSAVWEELILILKPHFRITVFDLPGHGKSDFNENCEDLGFIAQSIHHHIQEPSYLIGWSLGGLIALKIAEQYPENVKGFIGVCTSPKFLKSSSWPGIESTVLSQFSRDLQEDYEKTLSRFLLLQWPNPEDYRQKISALKNAVYQQGKPNLKALCTGLQHLETTDLREFLSKLPTPFAYILGSLDSLVPKAVSSHLSELNSSCAVKIIPKSAHAPFLSHAELFSSHLKDILEDFSRE